MSNNLHTTTDADINYDSEYILRILIEVIIAAITQQINDRVVASDTG